MLKDPVTGLAHEPVPTVARRLASLYSGNVLQTYEHALRGFTTRMSEAQVRALAMDPLVQYVEEDTFDYVLTGSTQTNPPYGLDRIDQRDRPLSGTYTYNENGYISHAYILDTGIRTTHSEFSGNATADFTAVNDGNGANDCNGHGTHVAGTVGGNTWGVAKSTMLHAVRVVDCNGNGTTSQAIAGVDWVTANHVKPAVANMSLQYEASQALDDSIRNSINAGVTYVVAANNFNSDACLRSPSRVLEAITVGATDSNDQRASFSSWGTCVDLFAPGVSIVSASNGSDTATATLSGTSMATPHVTGAVARYLHLDRVSTPATIQSLINGNATLNRVGNPGTGSPNRLLYTGFIGERFFNSNAYGGLSDNMGEVRFYTLEVPAGQARVDFMLRGGTGDADLYVRHGTHPTVSTWDCRPYSGSNDETCTFYFPAAGNWHIMIRAFNTYSDAKLAAAYSNPLSNGVSVSNVSGSIFEPVVFTLDVPAGWGNLVFSTNSGTGDVDLRVKNGLIPSISADCSSSNSGNTESCYVPNPSPGTWFVRLYPKFSPFRPNFSFNGVTLTGIYY
ncbi:S8 family serine peptidase [Archangium sp.]|uniref:S8 family serine peptidase n=1 Tax=Archangium sp. TaxID=1872627 RepID=UPI002D2525FD|nr:S8 family serine peptidase [Archangium sp.]HYO58207.1 S8 family serine peptidase [Archangium sp.]